MLQQEDKGNQSIKAFQSDITKQSSSTGIIQQSDCMQLKCDLHSKLNSAADSFNLPSFFPRLPSAFYPSFLLKTFYWALPKF